MQASQERHFDHMHGDARGGDEYRGRGGGGGGGRGMEDGGMQGM